MATRIVNRFPSVRGDLFYLTVLATVVMVLSLLSWLLEMGVFSSPSSGCPEGEIRSGDECYVPSPPEPPRPVFLVQRNPGRSTFSQNISWCLGGESHTRPLPLQGNALLLSYPGIFITKKLLGQIIFKIVNYSAYVF